MSMIDILNTEITRRINASKDLVKSQQDLVIAVEQFNKLDELYRSQQNTIGNDLIAIYKENKHFSGKNPLVYTLATTETYPFFNGTDAASNPYYPITKVQDKTYDGISPLYADPTKTGVYPRDVIFSPIESVSRTPAGTALSAFPDLSGEPLPGGWPGPPDVIPGFCTGDTPPGATDEVTCLANGGVWTPPGTVADPVWTPSLTAPALLRTALNAWKSDILIIIADLYLNNSTENNYWQNIVADINTVLAAITTDAVFVRATGDSDPAAWGQTQALTGVAATARTALITAASTGVAAHVTARKTVLDTLAATQESTFFGVIKLRLHQANGSYAKLKAASSQQSINRGLVADNDAAIASLNLLKVKNS